MVSKAKLEKLLEQSEYTSVVECPTCGKPMDIDSDKCNNCNAVNPLVVGGYI